MRDNRWPHTMRFSHHQGSRMGIFNRFSRQPTKDQFVRSVTKVFVELGDQLVPTYDEAEFQLRFDGESTRTMNLANLYAEYCRLPKKKRAAFLRNTCVGFINPMETPEDFEDARPDLLPTVRVRSTMEQMRLDRVIHGGEWQAFPSVPLSEHLEICLVYDLPKAMHFVSQENLDKWRISVDEAVEVAKQNLAEMQFAIGAIDQKLFVVVAGDAYDATRMLLLDQIRALPLSGQPVAMAVTRDSLMFAGSDDVEALGMLADMTEQKEGEPRPLCLIAHTLTGDEWVPWLPPADHPHHERFRLFGIKHYYRDYDEQKKLLDKLTGDDVFVASFSAAERDDKVRSYCVWPKGVVTSLPKTEYVSLYVPESEQQWFVSWERLQEVAGDLLAPLDCYPPRWLVNGWPTIEQIEAMGSVDLS